MSSYNILNHLESLPRIPEDPIPEVKKLREMLVEQILDLQQRYNYKGMQHTSESLSGRSFRYLERLCDMQLIGVTLNLAGDRYLR